MAGNTFLINRSTEADTYTVWAFDPNVPGLVTQIPTDPSATFPRANQLVAVGGYLLSSTPMMLTTVGPRFYYQLFSFDPTSASPLTAPSVQEGSWPMEKFWNYYAYRDCPGEAQTRDLRLVPATGYVFSLIPTQGRGSFALWNFDAASTTPGNVDPLPATVFDPDAFPLIGESQILLPIGNYVLAWEPSTASYALYSFDPQKSNPLSLPAIQSGFWLKIDGSHQLVVVGEVVLDWVPSTGQYAVWAFDPTQQDPLVGPIATGTLPTGAFGSTSDLLAVQTPVPIDATVATVPGTMDFMRSQIEHVVYYVLESRSFDNVVGWLYENGEANIRWVNGAPPFQGASASNSNSCCGTVYPQSQFHDGQLSTEWDIDSPTDDPFHGTNDSLQQQWGSYASYSNGLDSDMSGFVQNNGSAEVMTGFTPNQLPILNGLASGFAVSDMWFCSAPGGTTTNRAYLASGSAYDITVSYEGGSAYTYFPEQPHRQSMFKVLANNGITDWKIYWSVNWGTPPFPYTYHLFVSNQIPSVDAVQTDYVQPIDDFFTAAANGTLPAFSFLEPVWFDPSGVFTSYHPTGDIIPGEVALNKIYEAIKNGPGWDKTVLVISFSKGGGVYDHVPTPRAPKAWPHDEVDGFAFDAYGARIPTVVVSPWATANTVFRSPSSLPFDHTSLVATVLDWFGVPRARWGLGDRVPVAPTFECALQQYGPRTDAPTLTPSYDKTYPPTTDGTEGGC